MADKNIFDDVLGEVQSGAFDVSAKKPERPPIFQEALKDVSTAVNRNRDVAIIAGVNAKPDEYAAHKSIAEAFGVSTDFAARNAAALAPKMAQRELGELLTNNPPLADWYSQGDNPASIKVDELRQLDGLSWLWQSATAAVGSGQQTGELARLRRLQMNGEATPEQIEQANQLSLSREPRSYGADNWFQKGWVGAFEQAPLLGNSILTGVQRGLEFGTAAAGVAAIGGQVGPQIAAPEELLTVPGAYAGGFLVGTTFGAWQASFDLEAPLAFDEFIMMRDENGQPMDEDVARAAAIVSGMGSSVLETFADLTLARIIPGVDRLLGGGSRDAVKAALMQPTIREALKNFSVNVLKAGATEMTTEVAQEATQIFVGEIAKQYANTTGAEFAGMEPDEIATRLGDAAVQTAQAMTIMGPVLAGTRLGVDVRRAQEAQRSIQIMEALTAHAQGNTEMLTRVPGKVREAVAALTKDGPVQNVYVSPEAFSTYFQTTEELGQFMDQVGLAEEFGEASRLGRDVQIPVDLYYANIAGTEIGEAVKKFARISQDVMTSVEADEFNEAWGEAKAALFADYEAGQSDAKQALEAEERVFDDVKNRAMTAGITPDQAQQYAKLYSTFFRVLGERAGIDPAELFNRYGFDIKRVLPEETQYRPVGQTALDLAVIRSGKVEGMRKAVAKAGGPSLLEGIRKAGGLEDTGGELAAMNLPARYVKKTQDRDQGSLGGMAAAPSENSLDAMARRMWESGYFVDFGENRPGPNDLLDAIRAEIAGEPRYSFEFDKRDAADIQAQAGLVAFADALDQYGIDPNSMTDEEVMAALDDLVNSSPEAGALFQFAGKRARTIDNAMLTKAMEMLGPDNPDPVDRDTVFEETGFFKGADGKWRFEISDADATLRKIPRGAEGVGLREIGNTGRSFFIGALGDILNHDKLFAAYPSLAEDINVSVDIGPDETYGGGYDRSTKAITVRAKNEEDARSILLHEAAHAIQHLEGFARGGNPLMGELYEGNAVDSAKVALDGARERLKEAEAAYDTAAMMVAPTDEAELLWEAVDKATRAYFKAITAHKEAAQYEFYRRIAGEVEARNVQRRDDLARKGDKDLAKDGPWWTADVDPDQIIIVRSEDHGAAFKELDADFAMVNPTETEAFRKWFGDSKVVDEEGKPLVVFHGTGQKFEAFDPNARAVTEGGMVLEDAGVRPFFFSSRREVAEDFAGGDPDYVLPVYLSIKTPLEIDADGKGWEQFDDQVAAAAKSGNYDGVVLRNLNDSMFGDMADPVSDVYVAFEPTQIKSAHNRGTFDPADPRILYQETERTPAKPKTVKRGSIQFGEGVTIINMFDQADLSTFLHESGHFFLKVFSDIANSDQADMALANDWAELVDYLGIDADGTISVDAHEKFARSFEAYLFEGKAPSAELADIMTRFRSWLVFVYKQVQNLRAPINDKVRGVMDRMLATDGEIASMRTAPEFRPAFKSAAEAGMTPEQWERYNAAAAKAVDRAKQELDVRMMSEVQREATAEWRNAKAEIKKAVKAEYEALPAYRVLAYLRTGKLDGLPEGTPLFKLDRASIVKMMGEGALIRMPRGVPPIYRAEGGVHPDAIAELFDFKSGHDMLTAIMSAPPLGRAITEEVGVRMRAKFGDLLGDANARVREAEAAIANDDTGELLQAELEVLVRKGLVNTKLNKEAASRAAKQAIRAKPIREAIRLKLYMNANAKAAQEAEKAILKKDWKAAIAAKQRQLLNHYMAIEAREAQRVSDGAVKYLSKFTGKTRPKGITADYLEQIDGLLERFDLRKSIGPAAAARRVALSEWIAAQEAQGLLVSVPDALRNDAVRKPYREMTVDDLLALTDTVKSIEHLGRLKDKLLANKAAREFAVVRDEVLASIMVNQELKRVSPNQNPTMGEKLLSTFKSVDAALLKVEQVLTWLDGGDINGALRRHVWQPIAEAEARENDMRVVYTGKMFEILGALDKQRLAERITVGAVDTTFSRSEIMAVALNLGNMGNREKMMKAGNGKGPWSNADVNAITSHLNAAEWQAVQDIWDTINELWPEIAALQKRLSGVAPPKVEAATVETPYGTLKGGYYPIIYDPTRAPDVEDRAAANADKLFENTYLKPETAHGFTKERSRSYYRPILLDLDRAGSHIIAVIHDLTHREAIMDAHKILTDRSVRAEIEARHGREIYQQFVPWLQSVAHDNIKNDGLQGVEAVMRGVRSRATMVGMGFRISTILTQVAGYSSVLEMVKPRYLATGMAQFIAAPRATWSQVNALSAEMRHRGNQLDRDVRDELRRLSGKHSLADDAKRFAFHGISFMDRVVTVPAWGGAYAQHLASYPGDVAGATAFADQVVRLSQGAGGAKDLAAIQRQNEGTKLITMFYSYFSAYYNRQRTWGRNAKKAIQNGTYQDFPSLLAQQVFMTLGPAILADMVVGKGPGEDEDYASWVAKKVALYPFMALPLVRDALGALDSGFGYTFTPAGRTVQETILDPIRLVQKIAEGEATARESVVQAITTTGYVFNLPLGQLATTTNNVWKAIEEDDLQLRDFVVSR